MMLETEIQSWKGFRDVLRMDERELFDDMMDLARERASAGGSASVDGFLSKTHYCTSLAANPHDLLLSGLFDSFLSLGQAQKRRSVIDFYQKSLEKCYSIKLR
jgi:hypothetical protein